VYFAFEMPFTITPGTDTVRVGDTLRMEANFSDSLFDVISQKRYNLNCFPFPAFMAVRELIDPLRTFVYQKSATDAFIFLFGQGNGEVTGATFANMNLHCKNGFYTFKLEIIPMRKGVFAISLIDLNAGEILLPPDFVMSTTTLKRRPIVQFNRYIINRGFSHFDLFTRNALKSAPDVTGRVIEEFCTYTLVVN
jgi:hypothetical protein